MRRFSGSMGSVSRITVESEALKSNMLGDPAVRVVDVFVPAGHDGEGLPLLVDLVGFTGSGLSRHHMARRGHQGGARGAVLATTVSVTEEEKREILMNDFMLIPSADATAEEHARHAIDMVTAVAVRRTAKDVNRKWTGIMIWVARALAAVAIMMLIYALILRF